VTSSYGEPVTTGIDWIEETPNPLARSSRTRSDFLAYTFKLFQDVLPRDTQIRFERVLVCTRCVIVTMWFMPVATDEFRQSYRYWWICDR
jgi:hypothetical protein